MLRLICTCCGRRLSGQWLEAVPARGERLSARACSLDCAEALGRMGGLVRAWRYTAARRWAA